MLALAISGLSTPQTSLLLAEAMDLKVGVEAKRYPALRHHKAHSPTHPPIAVYFLLTSKTLGWKFRLQH